MRTLEDAQDTPAQRQLRSAAGVRSRPQPPPPAAPPQTLPTGHLNPAAAIFQPPGPPAPAGRPPDLLDAEQDAADRTVRAPVPAQATPAPCSAFDPGYARHVQAGRAVRAADQAGSPQAALDALVAGQARAQWDGALKDLTRAINQRSQERWNEALATALRDPSGEPLYRRWDPLAQTHKPRIYGSVCSRSGPRRVQVLLDSGATTSFIDTTLADQLGLPTDGALGPTAARSASGELTSCLPPVTTRLALGSHFQEELALTPFPIGTGDDIILGWDWMQGHDVRFLYADGAADVTAGAQRIQLSLFPAARGGPEQRRAAPSSPTGPFAVCSARSSHARARPRLSATASSPTGSRTSRTARRCSSPR